MRVALFSDLFLSFYSSWSLSFVYSIGLWFGCQLQLTTSIGSYEDLTENQEYDSFGLSISWGWSGGDNIRFIHVYLSFFGSPAVEGYGYILAYQCRFLLLLKL